jgi:murein DD-endopeptidase MepM/ murein hydrolase activator NlpD
MKTFEDKIMSLTNGPTPILDANIPLKSYVPIDLSVYNPELELLNIADPEVCQAYVEKVLQSLGGKIAYGGYLEKRNLYGDKANFSDGNTIRRDIHLGIDFWCSADTKVMVPVDGVVHSFKNNANIGDYGPTIILKHQAEAMTFYTLYGHLSIYSLEGLTIGMEFKKGDVLATLGTPDINVNYAPHLHFQIIKDLGNLFGDYPGVCSHENLDFYRENCPDPNLLLVIGG